MIAADRDTAFAEYREFLVRTAFAGRGSAALDGVRFAVDCSNGMASLLAHELFPGAIIINDTLDGTFPAHSPNPLKADARTQLSSLVRERGLDCGVLFDGDADRAMFVDERGDFVQPDYLVPIVARACRGKEETGRKKEEERRIVLHDVRTSRARWRRWARTVSCR